MNLLALESAQPGAGNSTLANPRLEALTTLRFFAALHVVIFHLQVEGILTGGTWWYRNLAGIGYAGVDFFFVLSGFILVYTYGGPALDSRRFWQARFARIYPAYLVSLVVAAPFFFQAVQTNYIPFFAWSQHHLAWACILTLTLLQSWNPQAALAWNPVCWSLSVEAFFYSFFPLLLGWTKRVSRGRLVVAIAACCGISFAISLAYLLVHPDGLAKVNSGETTLLWKNILSFNPLIRLPEFVAGMLTARLFLTAGTNRRFASALVGVGVVGLAVIVLCAARIPSSLMSPGLFAPLYAAIVYGLALRPRWASLLEMKGLVLLGNASYSLYLLHSIVISSVFAAASFLPFWPRVASAVIAGLAASILSYFVVESPARRLLHPRKAM
jgi:peptidoglycan/LPS O-acetylase OafA/YrhL